MALDVEASRNTLEELLSYGLATTDTENVYEHQWKAGKSSVIVLCTPTILNSVPFVGYLAPVGDFCLMDNRVTMHSTTPCKCCNMHHTAICIIIGGQVSQTLFRGNFCVISSFPIENSSVDRHIYCILQ